VVTNENMAQAFEKYGSWGHLAQITEMPKSTVLVPLVAGDQARVDCIEQLSRSTPSATRMCAHKRSPTMSVAPKRASFDEVQKKITKLPKRSNNRLRQAKSFV
jgi:hypothetical protein